LTSIRRINLVEMMAETCYLAESTICYPPLFNELRALADRPTATTETVAISAVAASLEQNAGAILVMSTRYAYLSILTSKKRVLTMRSVIKWPDCSFDQQVSPGCSHPR
jgi:pyruvate kinase